MEETKQPTHHNHAPIPNTSSYSSSFKNALITTGLVNFAVKTILAPLERWKIIAQTQTTYLLRPKKFSNFFDYLKRIPGEQGVLSFWRGNMTHCWMHFYQLFFQVFLFDSLKQDVKQYRENYGNSIETSLLESILLPLTASFASLLIIHPLDTYRVRLNMSYHKNASDAYFNKFRHFYSYTTGQEFDKRGLGVIYRGFFLANLIAILNFNLYFQLSKVLNNQNDLFSVDVAASFFSILLLHPLDTIKKIIQLNNMSKPILLTGYRTAYSYIKNNVPLQKLYSGLSVSLVKHGMSFGLFYVFQKSFEEKRSKNGD